jgi:lactoylglutathione lyase
MKVSVDQYCINVSDLARSVDFYENAIGLTVTHRIEEKEFREVVLGGESGNRIQLAWQRNQDGPIVHGNGFWKLYLQTDDCRGLYQRCIDWGAEPVTEPVQLEEWPVIAAFVKDPDGYLVEILETFGEAALVSGSMAPKD